MEKADALRTRRDVAGIRDGIGGGDRLLDRSDEEQRAASRHDARPSPCCDITVIFDDREPVAIEHVAPECEHALLEPALQNARIGTI